MPLHTAAVSLVTAPTVFSVFFSHFLLHRKSRKGKATSELSYDEGLRIIKRFIEFASTHTEDLQMFTKMRVPTPHWVHRSRATVDTIWLDQAATILRQHLSPDNGLNQIGGKRWWTIRDMPLYGEFIEMTKDRMRRMAQLEKADDPDSEPEPERIMLYIHGGAYFFSSLDTHRYQIQRHARKFSARAFAPAYRLAPQYPFPCGLLDCLASYLYLIRECKFNPDTIVFSGDSAGAGMVLALLVILRDQDLPLPAGATLLSPWIDLTHSFPSIMGDNKGDYIPPEGFHYRPSASWPPPPGDAIKFEVDGQPRIVDEQIQQYCSNAMVDHPLITLVNQGSLGGLPPLCIIGGGAELLRDEIIYLAHKAADPAKYPPSDYVLSRYPAQKAHVDRWPATKVHLLMFDHCAHVTPTLSFTKPAKFMYRAAASFNLWAIKAAKHRRMRKQSQKSQSASSTHPASPRNNSRRSTKINQDDEDAANEEPLPGDYDTESDMSSDSETLDIPSHEMITVTGVEPAFVDHMVRERVSTHGQRRPMEPQSEIACLSLPSNRIGVVSSHGPILRWLEKRSEWDKKYRSKLTKLNALKQADRALAEQHGFLTRDLKGERPPLGSVAGWYNLSVAEQCAKAQDASNAKMSKAITLWSRIAEQEDGKTQSDDAIRKLAEELKEAAIEPSRQGSQVLDLSGETGLYSSPAGSAEELPVDPLADKSRLQPEPHQPDQEIQARP